MDSQHLYCITADLDNRPLKFLTDFRPRARYIYFHYCIQVLRRAWQHSNPGQEASGILQAERAKLYWGTPGRYLP